MSDSHPDREPQKRCALGFNCSAMLQTPGLAPADCPNYSTCRTALGLPPDDRFSLQVAHQLGEPAPLWLDRHSAAQLMLRQRGCPQSLDTLGVSDRLEQVEAQLAQLRSLLSQFDNDYIAPPGAEAHVYNVKRPRFRRLPDGTVEIDKAVFYYNKLTSRHPIFAPAEKTTPVKVIHLSHDDDPRNLEARLGIERRNCLQQVNSRLDTALQLLNEAEALSQAALEL